MEEMKTSNNEERKEKRECKEGNIEERMTEILERIIGTWGK